MTEVNKNELLRFIHEAGKNTYAAPREIKAQTRMMHPFLPGHKCYYYRNGDWEYYDGYAGSLWAPGREVVLFQKNPKWSMAYQGQSKEDLPEEFYQDKIFPFLKRALIAAPENMPFRGPVKFEERDLLYSFDMVGNLEYFTGVEKIFHNNHEVFFQDVMGSLIK